MDEFGLNNPRTSGGNASRERQVLSVTQLNREARRLLEQGLPMAWVEGEISNLARPASGHWYFTLKDKGAQIRCAMFKNRNRYAQIQPREGQAVVVRGRVSLYEPRGDYQLIAENLTDAGEGALQRQFDALKLRLQQEGLFDTGHKLTLPALPQRIGVITSPTGAVIRDILSVLRRRFPGIPVRVYPVAVQGDAAADQIVAAIALATKRKDCDVLVLARGGGSLEDLWPFNEERVARAVFACPIPIVSAIGHETDVTISDFVADVRAPTPSAAAELLTPDRAQWLAQIQHLGRRLKRSAARLLTDAQEELRWLSGRLHQSRPERQLAQLSQRLDDVEQRLNDRLSLVLFERRRRLHELTLALQDRAPAQALQHLRYQYVQLSGRLQSALQGHLERRRQRLDVLSATLHTVGPQATLERGYAIVTHDKRAVLDAATLTRASALHIRFAKGSANASVDSTNEQTALKDKKS